MNSSDICIQCNLCCKHQGLKIPIRPDDSNLIQSIELTTSDSGKKWMVIPEGGCQFLNNDNGRCTIYSDRPGICRDYKCQPLTKYENGDITLEELNIHIQRGKTPYSGPRYFSAVFNNRDW